MTSYQYIVASGNPSDGFTYYGPFINQQSAHDWATRQRFDDDWWTLPLEEAT